MKCLEKHRERRYETTSALARDIERYLADEAAEARPPSAGYRFQKFVRRNKGRVIAAGLVLLALVCGIIGTSIGLVRAEFQRGLAIKARNAETARAEGERLAKLDADQKRRDAETNLGYAKKANELLGSVFKDLSPEQNYATVAELRDALKANLSRAIQDLEGTAIGDPLAVAEMQMTLGDSLLGLGAADQTIPLFLKACDTRIAKLGPEHSQTFNSMSYLALAYANAGKLDLAVRLGEETLKLSKANLGPDHLETLAALQNLAFAYKAAGRLPDAIALLERVRDAQIAKLGPDHPDTLKTINNLATAYQAAGRLNEAIPLFEEAHRAAKRFPSLRGFTTQLIHAYMTAGENSKLAGLLREQLAEARKTLPKDSPQLAAALAQFGSSLLKQKKWTEAEALLRECLAVRGKQKPDEWLTFNTKSMLGGALLGQKKYAEAEPLLLSGYEGMKKQENKIPLAGKNRLNEAVERLVQFYEATSKPDEAAKWRTELRAREDAEKNPEKKP
jgi:eukaryotic-like serine/threonine-protein kinase